MRTQELIPTTQTTPAKIVREIIKRAQQTYVPEDMETAVDKAIQNFYQQMRNAARQELKYAKMRIPKNL